MLFLCPSLRCAKLLFHPRCFAAAPPGHAASASLSAGAFRSSHRSSLTARPLMRPSIALRRARVRGLIRRGKRPSPEPPAAYIFPSADFIISCPIFSDTSLPSAKSIRFKSDQYFLGRSVSTTAQFPPTKGSRIPRLEAREREAEMVSLFSCPSRIFIIFVY
jgi:hypothetical protein